MKHTEHSLFKRVTSGKRVRYQYFGENHIVTGYTPGAYLVVIDGTCTSIKHMPLDVSTAAATLQAALHVVEDGAATAMLNASRLTPPRRTLTDKEKRAYAAYAKVMGDDTPCTFTQASMADICRAGMKHLEDWLKTRER